MQPARITPVERLLGAFISAEGSDRDLCFDVPTFLDQLLSNLRGILRSNIHEKELLLLVAINPG